MKKSLRRKEAEQSSYNYFTRNNGCFFLCSSGDNKNPQPLSLSHSLFSYPLFLCRISNGGFYLYVNPCVTQADQQQHAEEEGEDPFYGAESGWVEARTRCDHLASLSSDLAHIPPSNTPCHRFFLSLAGTKTSLKLKPFIPCSFAISGL